MNSLDKIKEILKNIPIIYYLLFFVVILSIHLYTNYSLKLYTNSIKQNEKKDSNIIFKDEKVRYKYKTLEKILGIPPFIETNDNLFTESVTWRLNFDDNEFIYGKYNGLDYIRLNGYIAKKNHPLPADVFVIVGKYINVPEHLYGPLKYASPTINIEQIYVPQKHILHYEKTGIKNVSLVTGSCASITISSITIKFVEDMIEKFKDNMDTTLDIHIKFRKEYNLRILSYLCGRGIKPVIPWFDPLNFKEDEIYNTGSDVCGLIKKNQTNSLPLIYEKDNITKILQSIDNNISNEKVTEKEIKNIFEYNDNVINTFKGGDCSKLGKDKCKKKKKKCIWNNDCIDNICPDAEEKDICEKNAKYADLCFWDGYNGAKPGECKPKPA